MRKLNIDRSIVTGVSLTIISGMLSWAAITKAVHTHNEREGQPVEAEVQDRLDDMATWVYEDVNNGEMKEEYAEFYLDNIDAIKNLIEEL